MSNVLDSTGYLKMPFWSVGNDGLHISVQTKQFITFVINNEDNACLKHTDNRYIHSADSLLNYCALIHQSCIYLNYMKVSMFSLHLFETSTTKEGGINNSNISAWCSSYSIIQLKQHFNKRTAESVCTSFIHDLPGIALTRLTSPSLAPPKEGHECGLRRTF